MFACDKICLMEKTVTKNKLIFNILFIATTLAIVFACIFALHPTTIVSAEESSSKAGQQQIQTSPLDALEYLDISQEGYVFTKDDIQTDYTPLNSVYENVSSSYAIFTNKSVTINIKKPQDSSIHLTSTTVYINNQDAKDSSNGYFYDSSSDPTLDSSYFLDINGSLNDKENYVSIRLDLRRSIENNKNEDYSITFSFFLIQTPVNFEKENSSASNNFIVWDYVYNSQPFSTTAPENDQTYETLNLTFPAGTVLNPVYVEFIYCGEHYKIYRYVDNDSNIQTFNALNNSVLILDKLSFNKSGTYTVKIYDKTVNSNCPNKNFYEYHFKIKNKSSTTGGFFMNVHTEDGTPIMTGQYVNENVVVDFEEFKSVKNKISTISVIRAYQPSVSENIPVETIYTADELPSSLTFTEDGSYIINIKKRNNDLFASYIFVITKSIKTSFKIGNTIYGVPEDAPANTTQEYTIENTLTSSFNGIVGETDFAFDLTVALSSPNITGVENNSRHQGSANLYVYGVGEIDVFISLDGEQMMLDTKYVNGDKLPTLTEQGKYYIRITDQMGSTVTRSFSITKKFNTASVILICIAISIVVITIIFFILSRRKVKVR